MAFDKPFGDVKPFAPAERETIVHLFDKGPIFDGNLISKQARDDLVERGFVDRAYGFNFLTKAGIELAVIGLDLGKTKT